MATAPPEEPTLIQFGEASPGRRVANRTFSTNFWGEKCKGYGVLLRNLKSGSSVSGHLADYLKERSSLEKAYITGLQKLHKSLQQINDAHLGTFYPLWVVLMKSVEDSFALHEQYLTQLINIAKDVSDYGSKLDEKLKHNRKGEIDSAGKSLKTYARTINTIAKTKKTYEHSCEDVIDQTRELERMKHLEGVKTKDIEKLEAKLKKTRTHLGQTQAEHVKSIQHHKEMLEEYKECMAKACTKFQALEEIHLDQLISFMTMIAHANEGKYTKLLQEAKKTIEKIGTLPIQQLINIYSQTRGTGPTKPTPYRFREVDLEVMIKTGPRPELAPIKAKILRPRKHSKESKAAAKKGQNEGKESSSESKAGVNGPTEGTPTPHEDSPEVDEEGYSIRPTDADKVAKFLDEVSSQSSSSDSEFDSDDEPELRLRKIKIKDLPVKPDNSSINDLMGAAAKLSLDAPPPSSGMKKATSSQSLKANIAMTIVREPSPVGSQSLFEGASGHPNNPLSPAGSVDTDTSQQSGTFSLNAFNLPEPLLPTLPPPPPDLGSTDLSAPLPSVSTSWASFDSPLPANPVGDTSVPNPTPSFPLNWADSSLGGLDSSSTSQAEGGPKVMEVEPASVVPSDLDPLPKIRSSPALLKAVSSETKGPPNNEKPSSSSLPNSAKSSSSSLPGPALLPPPSSIRASKRRSKIATSAQAPSGLLTSVPPAFAGQTPLQPVTSLSVATNSISTAMSNQSDSTEDKVAPLPADHTPSLQPTLSPALVHKSLTPGNESPLLQAKISEPFSSPSSPASFTNSPVTTPTSSPMRNPIKTSGAALSPLASVSMTNERRQSTGGGVVIPIAVAIHETCNAAFKGSKSMVKVVGEVMFSFPTGYVAQFANHAPLRFVVSQTSMVTRLIHNQNYLIKEKDDIFVFQMDKLSVYLKQFLQNQAAHVQFCNLPALKYDMVFSDITKLPLQLSCSWKCDPTSTNYQLNLTYVASHLPLSPKPSLTNVTATISVDGGVTATQSSPSGRWSQEHSKLLWNVGEMRSAEDPVPVTLQGKFDLSSGPSTPKPTVVQFICDGSTLSGLRLKLDTQAYKVSLYKNKVIAGTYMVEQVQET